MKRTDIKSKTNQPPMASIVLNWRALGLLTGGLVLGAALALGLMSQIFTSIPTDVRRLGIIFQSLQSGGELPAIVVFGNSVVMSGIDARVLTTDTPQHPVAWNCGTTGQKLIESYLLTQELPESVELAIYGIQIAPGPQGEVLHPQKSNTPFMYGFRPDDDTISTLRQVYGEVVYDMLTRSHLQQLFYSRWAIRQFVDTQTRGLLRSDLALDRATFDLHYPQSYQRPIDAAITDRLLEGQNDAYSSEPATTDQGDIKLAIEIARDGQAKSRRTVFLFPPVHPAILRQNGPRFKAVIRDFADAVGAASSATVVSFIDLLKPEDFIDDRHPTNKGAQTLTAALAGALQAD